MDGQHLAEAANLSASVMISDIAKKNRTQLAKRLIESGADREKVKRLIQYPEMSSIFITATSTDAVFHAKLRDKDRTFDVSNQLNSELPRQSVPIDLSNETAKIDIQLTQSGAAWSSSDALIESRFSDGSTKKQLLSPRKSGDGAGTNIPLEISINLPPPEGWPKL